MNKKKGLFLSLGFLVMITLSVVFVFGSVDASAVVINSKNWMDVYDGYQYAHQNGIQKVYFFTGALSTDLITKLLDKNSNVYVIESKNQPYFKNYGNYLRNGGFKKVKTIVSDNPLVFNRKLALEFNVHSFIVIDPTYSYNAVAVAPYAYLTKSWVLFANNNNIDAVNSLLKSKSVSSLLIYGPVDRNVLTSLSSFSPEIIDNKNRFLDDYDIANKFYELSPSNTAIVTSGDFIENEVMNGANGKSAVLFTGMNKIQPHFFDFINKHHIKIITIIDNALIPVGTQIRAKTNKSVAVFVKFGEGFTGAGSRTGKVYALSVYPLPVPYVRVVVDSVIYDPESQTLFVKFLDKGNMPGFVFSNINIFAGDNQITTAADSKALFITPSSGVIASYKVDLSKYLTDNLSADFYTLFGENSQSMDKYLLEKGKTDPPYRVKIEVRKVSNDAHVNLINVNYDKHLQQFLVRVKNNGTVTAFVSAQLMNVSVNGIYENLYSKVVEVAPGEVKEVPVKVKLQDADLVDTTNMKVVLLYGQSSTLLTKSIEKQFSKVNVAAAGLGFLTGSFVVNLGGSSFSISYLLLLILVLAVVFLVYVLMRRKKNGVGKSKSAVSTNVNGPIVSSRKKISRKTVQRIQRRVSTGTTTNKNRTTSKNKNTKSKSSGSAKRANNSNRGNMSNRGNNVSRSGSSKTNRSKSSSSNRRRPQK